MKNAVFVFTLGLSLLLTSGTMIAQQGDTAKDNTGTNKRDRAQSAVTADQQKENRSDVQITADIRKAVVDDKELSTYAHNIKIVTRNGKVTLKGPVRSEEEKKAIEAKATQVAGAGNVSNSISVKPKS